MGNILGVAKFDGNKGKTLTQILDLQRKGQIPISIEKYTAEREKIVNRFLAYLPAASDLFGSFAPKGVSFADSNKKFGSRYDGYNVSEYGDGKKLLFKLEKKLSDQNGNEIDVPNAVNHIILARLGLVDGKPVIQYEIDAKENAIIVQANPDKQICVPFFTKDGWYEFKNNAWTPSTSSNPTALYFLRTDNANWSGLFALGDDDLFDWNDRYVDAFGLPSGLLGVLAEKTGANAPAPDLGALAEKLRQLTEEGVALPAKTLKLISKLTNALQEKQ